MLKKYIIISLLTICGCSIETENHDFNHPNNQAMHRKSGIIFPEISNFIRKPLNNHDSSGLDVSVSYASINPKNPLVVTVYVYPAPKLFSFGSPQEVIDGARKKLTNDHFTLVKHQLINAHKGASLLFESETSMQFRGKFLYGREADFKVFEKFGYLGQMQSVTNRVELFAFGDWLIKFRATYPNSSKNKAEKEIKNLKQELADKNAQLGKSGYSIPFK